MGLAASLG